MKITKHSEIEDAIHNALVNDYPLTLEYDSGHVVAMGDELREAWENLDLSEPFTIAKVHDNLTPAQTKAIREGEGGITPLLPTASVSAGDPKVGFRSADSRDSAIEVCSWWSQDNPGQLCIQIDTTYALPEINGGEPYVKIFVNDHTAYQTHERYN